MELKIEKFISSGVRNLSFATSKWYVLTALVLDFIVSDTGIIFDCAPRRPAIPVLRSCLKAPTTSSGTASLNEFWTFGKSVMTYPCDIGRSVEPAPRFG